jgi:predicted HTH transcriptional regulator
VLEWGQLHKYRENNKTEAKKAAGGLPNSLWESYSAFANTDGGVILLGVEENPNKTLKPVGVTNPEKLVTDFWNTVNNSQKVSVNILRERNVQVIRQGDTAIVAIEVPRAERTDKPVYLNNDVWNAYRRNGEGDYHCSKASVKAMLRDSAETTQDMLVLEKAPFAVFDYDTVRAYRNAMKLSRPDHVWEQLEDDEFLFKLGAVGRGDDEKLHPTAAGLLMFGFENEIVREYPNYFLDYQEHFDPALRWSDRITSTSGEWSGNLFLFYYKAYNKLIQNPSVRVPFKLDGATRVDDTPIHKALREALANCLINADYYGEGGLVIKSYTDKITLENPGSLRIRIEEAISGGFSNPRNAALMKMFNMLDIGERAGSGIPNIYRVWENQKLGTPTLIEKLDENERVCLTLPLKKAPIKSADKKPPIKTADKADKKVPIKSADKKVPIKSADKIDSSITQNHKDRIIDMAKSAEFIKNAEVSQMLEIGETRSKILLRELVSEGKLVAEGGNRNRVYRLPRA